MDDDRPPGHAVAAMATRHAEAHLEGASQGLGPDGPDRVARAVGRLAATVDERRSASYARAMQDHDSLLDRARLSFAARNPIQRERPAVTVEEVRQLAAPHPRLAKLWPELLAAWGITREALAAAIDDWASRPHRNTEARCCTVVVAIAKRLSRS